MTKLIITTKTNKEYWLKQNILTNDLYMTYDEFIKKYYFDYDVNTIIYLKNKYHYEIDIITNYLNNLYYLKESNNEKILFLNDLKQELIDNNLLIINDLFKHKISSYEIYVDPLCNVNYEVLVKELNAKVLDRENNITTCNVTKYENIFDEINGTFTKIGHLINDGIDINNIYLVTRDQSYLNLINLYSKIYHIPVLININKSLINTAYVKKFINDFNVDNLDKTNFLYNNVLDIVNKYVSYPLEDIKEFMINDFKNISYTKDTSTNLINIVDLSYSFKEDDHVFILGFNEEYYPYTKKDISYLGDNEKRILSLKSLAEENIYYKQCDINYLNLINHKYLSYIKNNLTTEVYPSSLIKELNYEIVNSNISYNVSNLANQYYYVEYLDNYYKYNIDHESLPILNNVYQNTYNTYDHLYKLVNKETLFSKLNNRLNLSFSSLDTYYNCQFKFFLDYILKVGEFNKTFSTSLGNIFHKVLSEYKDKDFDFEKSYQEAILNEELEYSKSDYYYLDKLKEELSFIIETLKSYDDITDLNEELYEQNFRVNINSELPVTFLGYIDKLKYNSELKMLSIIDYKTYIKDINLYNLPYGLDMQLPIYLYLIKNSEFKDYQVAGLYLQNILRGNLSYDPKKDILKQKKEGLLLNGYSNYNKDIIKHFDYTYEDSHMIKSLKVKKDGDFGAYTKVLTDSELNSILKITNQNINNAINDILNGKFNINPKVINKKSSCEYCPYKCVCFKTNKDIVYLDKIDNLDFLKEEE